VLLVRDALAVAVQGMIQALLLAAGQVPSVLGLIHALAALYLHHDFRRGPPVWWTFFHWQGLG
jgi:hypothetical protein